MDKDIVFVGCCVLVLLAVIGLVLGMACCTVAPHYSDGERTGTVVKLSEKGLLWKTWDGTMNLGAFDVHEGGVMAPVVWEFTVSPQHLDLVPQIQDACQLGKHITLLYEQAWNRPVPGGHDYWVVGIK